MTKIRKRKQKLNKEKVLPIVRSALREDIGRGDVTTNILFPRDRRVKAVITAKEKGVVAGLDVAALVFKSLDSRILFKPLLSDGDEVARGKLLAYVSGSAKKILSGERTALNFLGKLSGIATQTNNFVKKIVPYEAKIMDTRKTTPNLRYLEKYAVRAGGGCNHRFGLYDQVLIKDNHISVTSHQSQATSLKDMIELAKEKSAKGIKVEVEVKNLGELKQALKAGPDIIMLDNFNIENIKKAVKMKCETGNAKRKMPELEVSGRVSLNNLRRIAACGVDRISVGSLTHSAKSLDISLKIVDTG